MEERLPWVFLSEKMLRKYLVIALLLFACAELSAQRLLRSHMVGDSLHKVVLVIRDVDRYSKAETYKFKKYSALSLSPGDYYVGYFVDTGFVHSEIMHVSHERSVHDQFIFIRPEPLHKVKFAPPDNGDTIHLFMDMDYLDP